MQVCHLGQTHFRTDNLILSISVSPTCSFTQLSSALVNVRVVSRSLNSGASGVLAGGWIQVDCGDGYRYNPLSGPLNITCLATGSWTQFPICSQ